MPLLTVRLIHTPIGKKESVLVSLESDTYSPDHLETLINDCLTQALKETDQSNLSSLQSGHPEISILLSHASGENAVRPSLHLSQKTLMRITEAGAAFDFDPYI